jgi:tRNA-2-methylthio-N6-dimethylallyladenosine synthase
VVEVTLLGQNVNSYGRDLYGTPRFAELLRAVGATGIERILFATSHPKDLSAETIAAMAEVPAVMPYLHLPVQAGSDAVLAAMNRGYTRDDYLRLVERVREAVPDITLSTDVIVGFPTETDEDFEQTMDLFERVRFDHAFTFIYSPREGTPAAALPSTLDRATVQARFDRLTARVREDSYASNRRLVGHRVTILVEGPSRRDDTVLAGRTPGNRLVHVPAPRGCDPAALAGSFLDVTITTAHPWFLSGTTAQESG